MTVSHLGMIERHAALPPLDLTPAEVAALADERVHDQAALAELDDRQEQAPGG